MIKVLNKQAIIILIIIRIEIFIKKIEEDHPQITKVTPSITEDEPEDK